jgi:transposase
MPRKPLSDDLRLVLVHMHHKRNLSVKEIERLTQVKARTIQHVLKQFHNTGTCTRVKQPINCVRKLNDEDHFKVCTDV